MTSGAQLFLTAWFAGASVYAVQIWATLKLSKARRACGAYVDFDHMIEALEKRGLLVFGLMFGALLFPLSIAYDVLQVQAKVAELEETQKRIEKLQAERDAISAELPQTQIAPEDVPAPPGYEWFVCDACGSHTIRKAGDE